MFNHHQNVQYNFLRKLRNNLTNAFDMLMDDERLMMMIKDKTLFSSIFLFTAV